MSDFNVLLGEFKLNLEVTGRKKEYVSLCLFRLRQLVAFVNSEYSITRAEDVRTSHVKQFIKHRQELGVEKNTTINGTISTLRVFYQFLVDEEYIDEDANPMRRIKNLKEEKNVILTFNDAEVKRILADVKEGTYSNVRDKLILITLFDTGIRVSELCGIKNEDVTRGHILIHGKGSKERLVYISRIMRRYMRKYEELRRERFKHKYAEDISDHYFLDQSAVGLSRSRINKILKEHCINAGVRKEVRCSPHDCRHYFAQKQLRNGIDVYTLSRLLGHYDTQITSKYLRGISQEEVLTIGKRFSPLNDITHI